MLCKMPSTAILIYSAAEFVCPTLCIIFEFEDLTLKNTTFSVVTAKQRKVLFLIFVLQT